MSTQTVSGHSFPTPCKQCGGALYRQVDYCPYCGAAHPLEGGPHKRTVIPGSRASAMNQTAQKVGFAASTVSETDNTDHAARVGEAARSEAAMHAPALASAHTPAPPLADPPGPERRFVLPARRTLIAIAAVVLIGLFYVAYALFSGNRELQSGDNEQSTDAVQDARTATGTIAPYVPVQPANHAAAMKPAIPGNPAKPIPVAPAAPAAPPVAVAPVKPAAPRFRDAAQALQAARLAFRANDLSAAQAALAAAQTLQPGDADAQNLADQLRPLIARRDAALQAAQTCAAQQSWPCARQHANETLAIDTGNDAAKGILERVIRETGWTPLNSHVATVSH